MISFFLPISLLVLAGFTLGLLVGWLTWVSSKGSDDQEPVVPEGPHNTFEPTRSIPDPVSNRSVIRDQAPDHSTSDLPFWRMREVSPWRDPDAVGLLE